MSMFDEKGEHLSIVGSLVGSSLTLTLTLPSRKHFESDSILYYYSFSRVSDLLIFLY